MNSSTGEKSVDLLGKRTRRCRQSLNELDEEEEFEKIIQEHENPNRQQNGSTTRYPKRLRN